MIVYEKHSISDPRLPFVFRTTSLMPKGSGKWTGHGNWHENIEIIYVDSGSGFVVIDGKHIGVCAGEIVPISANRFHGIYASDCKLTYSYLIIDRSFFLSNHFDSNDFVFDAPIRDASIENLLQNFKKYWYLSSDSTPMRVQYLRSIALELCLLLCDKHATYSKAEQAESNVLFCVKKAAGYIKAESHRQISLDEISSFVGLSKYYFAREFRRITGCSFVTYLNYVRCEKAKELLLLEERSVGEIGALCGFDNQSYFTRTFKEYSGLTPKNYRQARKAE